MSTKIDPIDRVFQRIEIDETTGCWLWTGYINPGGYGQMTVNRKSWTVHRYVYTSLAGEIPEGTELDHIKEICGKRHCCNVDHLEPVAHIENIRRGETGSHNRLKTHCPKGHPYTPENLYIRADGKRRCRACCIKWSSDYQKNKRRGE